MDLYSFALKLLLSIKIESLLPQVAVNIFYKCWEEHEATDDNFFSNFFFYDSNYKCKRKIK